MKKLEHFFIGSKLSPTNSIYENVRIKMNLYFSLVSLFGFLIAGLVILLSETADAIILPVSTSVLACIVHLICLKHIPSIRVSSFIFSTFIFVCIFSNIFLNNEILHLGTLLWIIILILYSLYTLGKAIGMIFAAVSVILYVFYLSFVLTSQINTLGDQLLDTVPLIVLEISIAFITILFTLNVYITSIRSTQSELILKNNELSQKNKEITRQHEEKIVMLKEIHHRVKNNLQIINSLIRLQSHKYKDNKFQMLFDDIQNRIFAMSAVHERIYKSQDLSDINIYNYFDELFKDLLNQYGATERVDYTLNTEVEYVNANYVIPIGLILNELISNSLKYGFKDKGNISFTYLLKGGCTVFDYRDDGKGFDVDKVSANFGLELIELLVEQMEGELKVICAEGRGVHYTISLPDIKD
ncbi:MAG: hypothetical protein COA32_08675 [Fluviicola sp.]|nr:MAG: hypothetical protein COA32_08675 [Fluviicola sp.]